MFDAAVAAHRGLSAEHPENTLVAFRAAVEAGFPAIELDVRFTHDGEVVCLHDAGIDRTTDGNGRVADMDYDELAAHPTAHGPIPRLTDVLSQLGDACQWNIELKAAKAGPATAGILEQHRTRALITAMDPRALHRVRAAAPDAELGLITLGPPDADDLAAAEATGCRWINVDHDFLDEATIGALHHRSRVGAWTINEPTVARRLADEGVDCIITDVRAVLEALA